MLKQETDELERLRDALRSEREPLHIAAPCPSPDDIWAAAAGEAPRDRLAELIDHAHACALCGTQWRLALAMAQQAAAPGGAAGVVRTGNRSRIAWLAVAAAAAGLALVAVLIQMRGPEAPPPSSELRSEAEDGSAIRSTLPPEAPLRRGACVLRWSGPAGALYDIKVSTEDLRPVSSARGLTAQQFTIPGDALSSLPPATVLLWQVDALLPDGRRASSRTFRSILE